VITALAEVDGLAVKALGRPNQPTGDDRRLLG
jgi:hypothetical protein